MDTTRTPYPSPLGSPESFLTSRRPRRNLGYEARYSENPTYAHHPVLRRGILGSGCIIESCAVPRMKRLVSGVWQSLIRDARVPGEPRSVDEQLAVRVSTLTAIATSSEICA